MSTPPREKLERKTDRLELRVTPAVKAMIQAASALSGLTPGDLAYESARRILEQHETMTLSGKDAAFVADLLLNPPEPSERLIATLRRRREMGD